MAQPTYEQIRAGARVLSRECGQCSDQPKPCRSCWNTSETVLTAASYERT